MTTASSSRAPSTSRSARARVAASVSAAPVFGVVRTATRDEAETQARTFRDGGLELIEITFTVPEATEVVAGLIEERSGDGPPWIGMGTVTTAERANQALAAGADFLITPNVTAEVAQVAAAAGVFLVIGALTPSEIVAAAALGADLVKVYPLPPVGGAAYLATIRQPLPDISILAAGGFGPEEIPAYRAAGASAFGLGAQLLGEDAASSRQRIANALSASRS
ncbi:MAG: 2-dehydro-3-deoxyphosphogluconate aldolase [bacterium]|nr:2-dehydro-3-deoxyphosphogluconate aldolase [bacterium]